jgi:hypothetical protein
MTEPRTPALSAEHALHDPLWMVALAARDPDLTGGDRAHAEVALESCAGCAEIFADIVAVSAAVPTASLPTRARDFTLTPADAARLRRRGLRQWVSAIGSLRDGVTVPLAMGLTTMGIAGLLFATVPSVLSGFSGAAAGPASQTLSTVGAPVPGAAGAATEASAAASAAPAAAESIDRYAFSVPPDTEITGDGGVFSGDGGEATVGGQRQDANDMTLEATIRDDQSGRSALFVVAMALLIAGLGLFALRWASRRFGDG